ncbi:YkvA family protein [Eubacterium multiforme]|uniref:Uncharacterized membrane protein YkvA (DUF1232 family) n=1 Tax=Eubacterium multiforme TaxID=83339 RepID=A0ABT9UR15_9FIRM|nr:YkvA family protein [Eubacterium multiforme]MDQ0148591.1 uncharacterized membrane protein YkvA (DUF1232 family) [Eubacterium multiforme]
MNISKVCVNLTGNDILTIVNDFVHVKGLILDEVVIDNCILVKGSFTKGLKIKFEATIDDISVIDGKIIGRFSKLKLYKLGIFRIFRSLALKFGLSKAGDIGIEATKDELTINMDKILEKVPFVKLSIEEVYIKDDLIFADVQNVNVSISDIKTIMEKKPEAEEAKVNDSNDSEENHNVCNKEEKESTNNPLDENCIEVQKAEEDEEEKAEEKEFEEAIKDSKKRNDYYAKGRENTKEKIEKKLPDNAKKYSDYLFLVPDLVALIFRLLKDERVPIKTKLTVSASVAYIICPTDMIPSNIPFIGQIDDLAVLFFALDRIAKDVPLKVIVENWSGKNELILVLKTGLEYVTNFTGARNVEKVYNIVEQLSTL